MLSKIYTFQAFKGMNSTVEDKADDISECHYDRLLKERWRVKLLIRLNVENLKIVAEILVK